MKLSYLTARILRWGLAVLCILPGLSVYAGQTIVTTSTTSCPAQGGMLIGANLITDFDNGTFGTESGAANQSPSTDPYPTLIDGGVFDNFYNFNWGDYGYVANPVTPRNSYQHADITDPVYGATGRFFASDPNADTPTLNFTIFNVTPYENYELSFWAANSEPNGTPNIVNAVVDGIVSYSTGPLPAISAALEWRRHAFVFNAGNRTTITFAMASTETGSGGRDFYIDNVETARCDLGSTAGAIEGRIFSDSNGNNNYDFGGDGTLANISVQLWDTQGDSDPSNDIFVSTTYSNSSGLYSLQNLAPSTTYELRVDTTDSDLPSGSSAGTATTLSVSVTAGSTNTGNDFGFDLSQALLEGSKSVAVYDPDGLGLYAVPGNDVIYTINVINRGAGNADSDSIVLIDPLPSEVTFFYGNMDVSTSGPVAFSQSGAGLSFNVGSDVRFAGAGPKPANFLACNLTPTAGYDSSIRYICLNPKGAMAGGTPDPEVNLSFRARID